MNAEHFGEVKRIRKPQLEYKPKDVTIVIESE